MKRTFLLLALCLSFIAGCSEPTTIGTREEELHITHSAGYIQSFEIKEDRLVLHCTNATIETKKPAKFDAKVRVTFGYGHMTDKDGRVWVSAGAQGGAAGTPKTEREIHVIYSWVPGEGMSFEYRGHRYVLNK